MKFVTENSPRTKTRSLCVEQRRNGKNIHHSRASRRTGVSGQSCGADNVQQARTQETSTQNVYTQMDDRDRLLGQIWGLTNEEMIRAKVLLEGPRKSFSVENLSPIEALGIHARTDAERRKYAEMFARAFHADVERSLAWNQAFTEAMARLYPNESVVDFSGGQRVAAPLGAADALGVPRSLIVDQAPSAQPLPRPLQQRPAAPKR